MKSKATITTLTILIVVLSVITTLFGILSNEGPGVYEYLSIRGQTVEIYGKGIYGHMSADVAIQGIAQDYVTLFIAVPLLLISLWGYRKKKMAFHFLYSGTAGYFFVTFLFYTAMGMYNIMFLPYITLLGLSFFALAGSLLEMDYRRIKDYFSKAAPVKTSGYFLIINSILIALLWLSQVVPPLLDGSIYPLSLQHYTTLIVQGFDLGLLLPLSFVSGLLIVKDKPMGYLATPVYLVFLSLLMTALTAKIIAMALNGVNVIPVIFIIPTINIITIVLTVGMISRIHSDSRRS